MDDGSADGGADPITTDVPAQNAQQLAATILLAPCVVGWTLALFLAGYVLCTFLAYRASSLYAADRRRVKVAVWVVTFGVLIDAGINANETYHYLVSQARDYDSLASFTAADCLPALPQGIVQAFVQTTLGERACGVRRPLRHRRNID